MNAAHERLLWTLGLSGLLPFIAAALAVLLAPDYWGGFARGALIAYGAVILSFLGAVHWGLALRAPAGEAWATPARLVLGVVPSLIGWAAMLLFEAPSLLLLAAGILATAGVEQWAASRGLVPRFYMRLRWVLSVGAASCLLLPFLV
ncbi:DUF3429 domain-containing protein [Roseococcus thiosulfatophilus]|uniref:DUF3429 domain-containing protein n=1 Tax=Roseococcus thiosulfatophilus TaxID=35813 RepID=UPI001A8D2466|nr:DUF3429 domain-containing protein [Roseococcus thiosulfatophilus]